MKTLDRELLAQGITSIEAGITQELPVKVLQFGEGNFLRAFVDYMIDELNTANLFNGGITVVQPIEQGLADLVNQQDGLYTIILRGLENGSEVVRKKIITSIKNCINPYKNFEEYFEQVKNPDLRFIISNTTEAGITYKEGDKLTDKPQVSFPAKITALLYERYRLFSGDTTKGFIFMPCELIDNNGDKLKEIVLQYAKEWELEEKFVDWIENSNYFTNTLVDRIVTGYPRDEVQQLQKELGYVDNLLNTAEIFHFFVIEAPKKIAAEIPFEKAGLNVVWTDDATPYKSRKVRILNGGHTMSVLAAYLCGKETVGEMMDDSLFIDYLKKGIFDEIIPTLDLDYADLKSFADSVFDRFANPYIKHYLLSIALNSVSKYKTRVLPSILEYYKRKNELPKVLTTSFAALIAFYSGKNHKTGKEHELQDDAEVLEFFKTQWASNNIEEVVKNTCANISFWGEDLNKLAGFTNEVTNILKGIVENGMEETLKKL